MLHLRGLEGLTNPFYAYQATQHRKTTQFSCQHRDPLPNNGFTAVRTSGSHHIMKKPGYRFVLAVPIHGEETLKKGVLQGLIRAAGKTVEQFLGDLD